MVDTSYIMQAVLVLFTIAAQLSSAHDSKPSEVFCNASSTFHTRTCSVPEHSTVVLRVPEGSATWFKRLTDSLRALCVGSQRCVLPRAKRGDAGLYYAAVQLGPSGSATGNKYFVKLDVMIPPVLQNVVECDSSRTRCWTAAAEYYWDTPQFTISVAYIGVGTVTWTRSTDGSDVPFTCGSTPTRCTISSSTYQMVHYVNITLHNSYDPSEQEAIYTANVTNEAGYNTSSTQVNLLCSSPSPPSGITAVSLTLGSVGNLTCLANVDTKYQINICYTSASNRTNCSACPSQSEGPCPAMPGKPRWSVSSAVSTTVQGCKQRSVSVIMDSVGEDDAGTVSYYWVAVTPKLYQSYLVTVDRAGTGLWLKMVVGVSAATLLLIVVGIVVSLCMRRRGKVQLVSESGEGQIQSETQPLLVETGTVGPILVVSEALQPPLLTATSHPPLQSPQCQISIRHPPVVSPQHLSVVSPQHPSSVSPQLPTPQHPLVASSQLQTPHHTAEVLSQRLSVVSPQHPPAGSPQHPPVASMHLSGFAAHSRGDHRPQNFLRSDSSASQPTSYVSLVPEEDECVEDV